MVIQLFANLRSLKVLDGKASTSKGFLSSGSQLDRPCNNMQMFTAELRRCPCCPLRVTCAGVSITGPVPAARWSVMLCTPFRKASGSSVAVAAASATTADHHLNRVGVHGTTLSALQLCPLQAGLCLSGYKPTRWTINLP